jgi:hypothetical protein
MNFIISGMANTHDSENAEGFLDHIIDLGSDIRTRDASAKRFAKYTIEGLKDRYIKAKEIHSLDSSYPQLIQCRECSTKYGLDIQALTGNLCPDCYGELNLGIFPISDKLMLEDNLLHITNRKRESIIDILDFEDTQEDLAPLAKPLFWK